MKIYTKSGDTGETYVYTHNATRVDKDSVILECYGSLDELNAHVGMLQSLLSEHLNKNEPIFLRLAEQATDIQRLLFKVGFAISDSNTLTQDAVTTLEIRIDELDAILPKQTSFILPGGSLTASQAHICRTTCRRAERQLVTLSKQMEVDPVALAFVNRLSDYWFVVARVINHLLNIDDIKA